MIDDMKGHLNNQRHFRYNKMWYITGLDMAFELFFQNDNRINSICTHYSPTTPYNRRYILIQDKESRLKLGCAL